MVGGFVQSRFVCFPRKRKQSVVFPNKIKSFALFVSASNNIPHEEQCQGRPASKLSNPKEGFQSSIEAYGLFLTVLGTRMIQLDYPNLAFY